MMQQRSYEKELLDKDDIPFADILVNMQELEQVNRLLGGHKITCDGVKYFTEKLTGNNKITIAEIGCGGGDNIHAISNYLIQKKINAAYYGIDIKPECIAYAKQHDKTGVDWITSDYREADWTKDKPDIIFSSLFCHHFTDEELIEQLQWLKQNSNTGFFINDLQRNAIAYYAIKWITKLVSKSYLVKNDAPLSVKRGFKKVEWEKLLQVAGIKNYTIKWRWAFRYLVCVTND